MRLVAPHLEKLFAATAAELSAVKILAAIIGAAAIVQFVLFAVFLDRTMILSPFTDMIDWIDAYFQARQHGNLLGYLWAPHNEHHLVFIRALTALDVAAFKARGIPFIVAATIATIATAFIIYVQFRRDKQLTGSLAALAWLAPMLLLNTAVAVDCSAPTNSVYPISLVFLVGTLVLFSAGAEFAPNAAVKRPIALVTAILASLSNALGLLIWPAILWLAWRNGASKRWLIGIGAIGTAYGALYVWTLHGAAHIDWHLAKMADYLLAYLGLPFSRVPGFGLAARVLGAVLLVVAVLAILWDTIARRPATQLHLIGTGLIIVALGAAFLAAIARVDVEQEVQVPYRYAIFVALLHIGLLALALPFFVRLATTPQRQITLLGAVTVFAIMLVVMQITSGRHVMIVSTSIQNAIARYEQTGVLEPGMERLFPNLPEADRVFTELRNAGR